MLRNLVALSAVLLIAAGCSSYGPEYTYSPVPQGIIATDGVVIRDEAGTFKWSSGQTFIPSATMQSKSFVYVLGTGGWRSSCEDVADICTRVRVKLPGYEDEFYGVLLLSKARSDTSGPGTRSYYIAIPDRYIEQATDGRVSVVYELVEQEGGAQVTSWVLWFSDMPF